MAVTVNTQSKPIGWSRSDVIDMIEDAHTACSVNMASATGLVAGVKSHTYGGLNTSNSNETHYYDVFPTSWTGSGTGASFHVTVNGGLVTYVEVNRPGTGYANGDVLTLNDLDFGGNGSNGVQDIQVTVYIENTASGGSTYTCEYDSSNNLTGIDANGSIVSTPASSAANITIKEGDTLLLKGMNDDTYIMWYDFTNDSSLGNSQYNSSFRADWSVSNVVNQGARGTFSSVDGQYLKWKPAPGQAGTYYIKQDDDTTSVHTITVVAADTSNVVITNFGATNAFFDKQNDQGAEAPWGVVRREVQSGKKFGITYQSYQFNDGTDGQVELNISTGGGYRPTTSVLPNAYTINGNARSARGNNFHYGGTNTPEQTSYDIAGYMYDARFKGTPLWDKYGSPQSYRFNQTQDSGPSSFATMGYQYGHGRTIADRNAYNAFSLDLISYQSGLDPNFVVYSFKQPNLSSTKLRDNSFLTWFVHDYTSSLFNYDDLWLGGVTVIRPSTNEGSGNVFLTFRSSFGGQFGYGSYTGIHAHCKRTAEYGFLPVRTSISDLEGSGSSFVETTYGSTSHNSEMGSNDRVNIYTRSNQNHTYRGIGGQTTGAGPQYLPASTEFNAVIKGLPLSVKIAPVPYYLPNDFALIDFDIATPSANVQQGDTITVSGTEVYTIITGSYDQTDRTRGILFCARTT